MSEEPQRDVDVAEPPATTDDTDRPRGRARVYTRTGDDGTTALLLGGRVPKNDVRTDAYGTVDETVSALGLARSLLDEQAEAEWSGAVLAVQRELFVVGAQLATHAEHATV